MTYSDKLKDPRWIKLSNRIKEMYDYRCSGCGSTEDSNTHHLIYRSGYEPWDYKDSDLTVMCKFCHNEFHKNELRLKEVLANGRLVFGYEFGYIIDIIDSMSNIGTNDYCKVLDFVKEIEKSTINF